MTAIELTDHQANTVLRLELMGYVPQVTKRIHRTGAVSAVLPCRTRPSWMVLHIQPDGTYALADGVAPSQLWGAPVGSLEPTR